MGMFDSVYVKCPHCAAPVEFQSKEWDCNLDVYSLDNAPTDILRDIMNYPQHCEKCGGWMALVDPAFPPGPAPRPDLRAAAVIAPEAPHTHPQGMKWWPHDRPFSFDDLVPET